MSERGNPKDSWEDEQTRGLPPDDLTAREQAGARFDHAWSAWSSGQPEPDLAELLPIGEGGGGARIRAEVLHELILHDLEHRWKRSKLVNPPATRTIEEYLALFPECQEVQSRGELLELVAEEYRARWRWGDRPAREVYLQRFAAEVPELAGCLDQVDAELSEAAIVAPPPVFPHYEILEELGRGGMGVVYKARDRRLDREVALKVVVPGAGGERFEREAKAVARFQHPGIVKIHEIGQYVHRAYFTMELITGGSLKDRLVEFRSPRRAAVLVAQIAEAVHHAHGRGILHRDLKPSNVLLDGDVPKLIDFGLSKELDPTVNRGLTWHPGPVGTPRYMAPEQADPAVGEVTTATDIHALGLILYELLTGSALFQGSNTSETLRAVKNTQPDFRLGPPLPSDLRTICRKCVEKDSAERYRSAAEVADDLHRWLSGRPILARPASGWERAWKWLRRHPATSALSASLLLTLLSLIVIQQRYNLRLVDANNATNEQQAITRNYLYTFQIREAYRNALTTVGGMSSSQVGLTRRAIELLDANLPSQTENRELRGFEWFLLDRLLHGETLSIAAHRGEVKELAYDSGGRLLASIGADRVARVWNALNGGLERQWEPQQFVVNSLAFHPQEPWLATAGDETTIRLWNIKTGELIREFVGHALKIHALAFAPDGKTLASGGADGVIRVWNVADGSLLRWLVFDPRARKSPPVPPEPPDRNPWLQVHWLGFGFDGERLIALGSNGSVGVWSSTDGVPLRIVDPREDPIKQVALGSNGRFLWGYGLNGELAQLDLGSGDWRAIHAAEREERRGNWTDLAVARDGSKLVLGGRDREVHSLDTKDGRSNGRLLGHHEAIGALALAPVGDQVVSGDGRGMIKFWSGLTPLVPRVLKDHVVSVRAVAVSPDGSRLASGGDDLAVKVWNLSTGELEKTLGKHVYNRRQNGTLESIDTYSGHGGQITGLAFHPDGRTLASASIDHTVRFWSLADGAEERSLRHPSIVYGLDFSPDGTRLATACWDQNVHVWDVATGQSLMVLNGHSNNVCDVGFSRDGRVLYSVARDGLVIAWDLAGRQPIWKQPGSDELAPRLSVSPDGAVLAVTGSMQSIDVRNASTGEFLFTLQGHSDRVMDLKFSPDGRRLISTSGTSQDSGVHVWDLTTRQEVALIPPDTAGSRFFEVAMTRDGNRLIAGRDNQVLVWDCSARPRPPVLEPTPVAASPARSGASFPALKVLGWYLADGLRDEKDEAKFHAPTAKNEQLLVVVVALPKDRCRPTEEEYTRLIANDRKKDPARPSPPREVVTMYLARLFQLSSADLASKPCQLLSIWELGGPASGFHAGGILGSSTQRVQPDERILLGVAVRVPRGGPSWPLRIRYRDDDPVEIAKEHRLAMPPRSAAEQAPK